MNNINFSYWLQGFFELVDRDNNKTIESELTPVLSEAQVNCIREHLALVKKYEPLHGFAAWLEGYLDARVGEVGGDVGTQGYLAISSKLKESFVHASSQPHYVGGTSGMASLSTILGQMGSGTALTC